MWRGHKTDHRCSEDTRHLLTRPGAGLRLCHVLSQSCSARVFDLLQMPPAAPPTNDSQTVFDPRNFAIKSFHSNDIKQRLRFLCRRWSPTGKVRVGMIKDDLHHRTTTSSPQCRQCFCCFSVERFSHLFVSCRLSEAAAPRKDNQR